VWKTYTKLTMHAQNSGETLQALWEHLGEKFRNSEKSTRILNMYLRILALFQVWKIPLVLLQAMKDATMRILALFQVWKIPLELLQAVKDATTFPTETHTQIRTALAEKMLRRFACFLKLLTNGISQIWKKSNCKCSCAIWNVTTFLARRLLRDPHRGGRMLWCFTCFWKH
jgi:hypothetical protein